MDVFRLGQEVSQVEARFPPERSHSPLALQRQAASASHLSIHPALFHSHLLSKQCNNLKFLNFKDEKLQRKYKKKSLKALLTICLHRMCSISEIKIPALPTGSKGFRSSLSTKRNNTTGMNKPASKPHCTGTQEEAWKYDKDVSVDTDQAKRART